MSGAPRTFTLVIFMKVDNIYIVDVCVEFLFYSLTFYSSDFHEGRQYFITLC